MGNSSNKEQGAKAIKLKIDNKSLHFKANEVIQLCVKAECENVTIPKDGLEYQWTYSDSFGYGKSETTKDGVIMLACPNAFCGRAIAIEVEVALLSLFEQNMKMAALPGYSGTDRLKDAISIVPTCDRELADKGQWFPESQEIIDWVSVTVDIFGYNGSEIGVRREITDGDNVVWKNDEKITVANNMAFAEFSRANCPINAKEDKTYTFKAQFVDVKNGNVLNEYSKEYTLKGHTTVTPITSYPLQPVFIGNVDIAENNYMPCKYSQIDVEYTTDKAGKEKSKVTIFKEGSPNDGMVNIIGGERKATVTLLNYTPKKCTRTFFSHMNNTAPFAPKGNLPISVSGEQGTIKDIELAYNYGDSVAALLLLSEVKLFQKLAKYFWPTRDAVKQSHLLRVETCRHSHDIVFNMYPDIEFEFAFIYNNDLGLSKLQNRGIHIESVNPYNSPSKIMGMEFNFGYSLSLKATFDDETELTLDGGIKEKIETTFGVLHILKKYISMIFGTQESEIGEEEFPVPTKCVFPPKVFSAFIKTPSAAMGIKWKANYEGACHVGTEVNLFVKIDPLLSIGVYFDVVAFVARHAGPWGLVITGVRAFLSLAFNTEIKLYITVVGSAGLSMGEDTPINEVFQTSGDDNNINIGEGEVVAEIQAGLEVSVKGKFVVMEVAFQADLYGKGGLYYKLSFGADNSGMYYIQTIGHTSVEATGAIKGTVSTSKGKRQSQTPYGEVAKSGEQEVSKGIGKTFKIMERDEWWTGEKNYFK